MKKILTLFCLLFIASISYSQTIEGYVHDALNKESLAGVSIYYNADGKTFGAGSDMNGHYELKVPVGKTQVTFSYIGYENYVLEVDLAKGETVTYNIDLMQKTNNLDELVFTAGRFDQKLSEITVSMNVVKPAEILRQDPKDIRGMLATIPGVDITDKQPSIRSGSGWTYGVGSRSLIMVDGLSILTPGVGEINWNAIPKENIQQIEVIKGASSVLYGSSALNGLINIRTARPSFKPSTNFSVYTGVYENNMTKIPMYGIDFSHSQRVGNWDIAGGVNLFNDDGYRQGDYTKRFRIGGNVTHHNPHVRGLSYGVNANYLYNDYGGFFIWRSPEEKYTQSPLANMGRAGHSFYVDPFINYANEETGISHSLKARIYGKYDRIVSNTTGKSIETILSNMGFKSSSITDLADVVMDPVNNLLPRFLPYLKDVLNGNVNGAVNELVDFGNSFFPNATTADYVDLISWMMGRPFPQDAGDVLEWLTSDPVNNFSTAMDPTWDFYVDYQFNKKFDRGAAITTGFTYDHLYAATEAAGRHVSDNAALFFQYDDKFFDRLSLSLGVRFEYYRVDDHFREANTDIFGLNVPIKPIFRGGLNYQAAEHTFIRASFGQGYRYPSVTEKYIYKSIGGAAAYPNPNLKAEEGFNAEIGLKQGYQFGPFKGYMDFAAFYTQYDNMIEFQVGVFNDETYQYVDNIGEVISMIQNAQMPGIGVQFSNVDRAVIYGIDWSFTGVCDINKDAQLTYNLGYVYTEPRDVNYKRNMIEESKNTDLLAMKSKSNDSPYLKYRSKHSVKGVFDFTWKWLNVGANIAWKSKILAVDYFMVDERPKSEPDVMDHVRTLLFGNLHDYWEKHNTGYVTLDLRAGVRLSKKIQLQFIVNNVLNTEYSSRPMDVAAPRNYVIQFNMNL